jgi:hypothetical protein
MREEAERSRLEQQILGGRANIMERVPIRFGVASKGQLSHGAD